MHICAGVSLSFESGWPIRASDLTNLGKAWYVQI